MLLDENHNRLVDEKDIEGHILTYYKHLLREEKSCVPVNIDVIKSGPKLPDHAHFGLVREASTEEIRDALWSIGDSHAPGLDEYIFL